MGNYNPATTYTLDDFVEMQISDNLTYYNFSIIEVIDGAQQCNSNLVEEYLDVLKDVCVSVQLTDEQLTKYKYCPDLLAYDVYKSTQLDFVILLLNDMIDPKEFDRANIMLPTASRLSNFLNAIYSKEQDYINLNRSEQGLLR